MPFDANVTANSIIPPASARSLYANPITSTVYARLLFAPACARSISALPKARYFCAPAPSLSASSLSASARSLYSPDSARYLPDQHPKCSFRTSITKFLSMPEPQDPYPRPHLQAFIRIRIISHKFKNNSSSFVMV